MLEWCWGDEFFDGANLAIFIERANIRCYRVDKNFHYWIRGQVFYRYGKWGFPILTVYKQHGRCDFCVQDVVPCNGIVGNCRCLVAVVYGGYLFAGNYFDVPCGKSLPGLRGQKCAEIEMRNDHRGYDEYDDESHKQHPYIEKRCDYRCSEYYGYRYGKCRKHGPGRYFEIVGRGQTVAVGDYCRQIIHQVCV